MNSSSHTEHAHDDAMHAHHGSLRGYLTGFVLAAILTIIPFWLVMGHVIESRQATILIVLGLAAVQILVHMIFFLHLDTRSESGWNMLALIFTGVLVAIVLGASIWVMYNENANMMPMSPQYMHHKQGS
ncbi:MULTISPECIES: cytochrome o ubiquinol oxidase subunit IV [Oleiagrimonas]|uniref:Cytochrome bo(3) ubiquinol oxidase subunit 4 n=1 Tax=Oleiagrimonas citrea TaxID=1665687 RepID=A0A846ZJB5_9GAMM|nr:MULTISPECIES: cytochrome o ubiquinol oxidase subunit IV [Oleiagrimonas]NKZ38284.1 cytochrome o ubiquinol oxidase subunit IV [Oleiagrimonas citrea]RAP58425.1 cytochrome o ubiquinol oxidase subunit IV [Oleiagrimonas sp. MCCC 1A03011]